MAQDITKVKLGTCQVTFNGTDLGHTIGGCEATYEPMFKAINVDKYGGTDVERILIGEKLSVKIPLAETSIANLAAAMPHGTRGTQKISVGSVAGKKQTLVGFLLTLHPFANATNDKSEDFNIFKAASSEPVMLPYKNDNERVYEVTFTALLDEGRTDGNMLGVIGDSLLA